MITLQFVTIGTLMIVTKVRKVLRGRAATPFPVTPPRPIPIGEQGTATTFTYGADLYEDMLGAIDAAQDRILFETYIIKGDAMGERFKQALIRAADRGVDVYVVYDAFANLVVKPSFLRFPGSIHVLRYPIYAGGLNVLNPRSYGRDHRKILVVDKTVGYVGGFNGGTLYATEWRDTHVKIVGPSVWDLDNAFVDFWNLRDDVTAKPLEQLGEASWEPQVRAHRNVPRQLMFPIRGMYLEAIDRAKDHIYITAAYFIPDRDILQGLIEAASRGVDVRILMPEVSNHAATDILSRGFYGSLLRGGVRILLYQDWMVHAKTATIDGRWTTIGTANIDRLSLTGNYEINMEFLDAALAAEMETIFENDSSIARELSLEEWESRPWVARACELIVRPLRPLL
jgi:cardiolipin synthase